MATPVRGTVLVVEDDPWTRTTETALLASEGYAVLEARNGEEGLHLVGLHAPDVVLLDLALPRLSGLEVLRAIKGAAATSHIPVVVVSAYGDMMAAGDAGQADGVLRKPFDCDELLDRVDTACRVGSRTTATATATATLATY